MKSKKLTICFSSLAGIVLIAAILVLVNIIFKPLNARMDCTADKLYTLSEGTKETLKGLTDTVSIRFYYSKDVAKMPVYFKNYAMRVEDLLQEYKQVAGKKLEIKKLNPKPDTDAEDSANLDGISGKSLDVFGDEQIYLGLAVSCGNRTEAIPFLSPDREKLLEYDLIEEVGRLDAPGKPLLFGTTEQFLRSFGVKSIGELPTVSPEMVEDFKVQAEAEAAEDLALEKVQVDV